MGVTNASARKHMSISILDFLSAADGIAQLWAVNSQFLGVLSSNQYDLNSISNPYGFYGGSCGIYSIQNPSGMYGGACGFYSPYNISCINPPVVLYQNQPVLVVTKNPYAQTNGLPVVDPDLMLGIYGQLATGYQQPTSSINTETYRRTVSASNAEVINAAMRTATWFH
jgi:hypothetical protein